MTGLHGRYAANTICRLSLFRVTPAAGWSPGSRYFTSQHRWRSVDSHEKTWRYTPVDSVSDRTPHSSNALQGSRVDSETTPAAPDSGDDFEESKASDGEAFYDYYLRDVYRKPPYIEDPGQWILHPDVRASQSLLPASLRERPLDFFAGDSRDLATGQRCLEKVILNNLSSKGSKTEMRKAFVDDRPGSQGLAWLLDIYDEADVSNNLGFLKCLVHCLVAEGKKDLIWGWLDLPHVPTVLQTHDRREHLAWRGSMLRFMVESQAYWAEGPEWINLCLHSFEQAWNYAKPDKESMYAKAIHPLTIDKTAAGLWIINQLLFKAAGSAADPQLYDQFISRMKFWRSDPVDLRFKETEMQRVHPLKPSALPALKFLKHYYAVKPRPIFLQDLLSSLPGRGWIIKSAVMLNKEGFTSEARWMLDVGRAEMPCCFHMKSFDPPPPRN